MLRTFDPFSEMSRLSDELHRRLENNGGHPNYRPAVDIFEDGEAIHLAVDLPGIKREDIHVNVEKNLLTITGERVPAQNAENQNFHRVERAHGTFTRSFSLPETIDSGAIEAQLRDGVLNLRLTKRAEVKPRQIEVKISN